MPLARSPRTARPRLAPRRRAVVFSLGVLVALSIVGADHSVVSVLMAILGVGSLIAVHEYGHFLACRLTGTRVETFSIGFGPRLFGWETPKGGKRRFTVGKRQFEAAAYAMDVRIAAIPLGGYVKMAGEIGGDGTASSGAAGRRAPLPDEFPAKSISQRAFIASAGVIMNAIAALVAFTVAYGIGYADTPPVIGAVRAGDPAWHAGIKAGDRIVSYDGTTIRTFTDIVQEVALAPRGAEATVELVREGRPMTVRLTPAFDEERGLQTIGVDSASALTLRGGGEKSGATVVEIGATEPVTVDGRRVIGGHAAGLAVADAINAGRRTIHVEKAGSPPVDLDLGKTLGKEATSGPYKLGVGPAAPLVVKALRAGGTLAVAGLQANDEVLAADGEPVFVPSDLSARLTWKTARVRRAGAELDVPVGASDAAAVQAAFDEIAFAAPKLDDAGTRVVPSGSNFADGLGPAATAGIRRGDRILAIAGKDVKVWKDIQEAGKSLDGKPIVVRVQAGAEPPRDVTLTPQRPRDIDASDDHFRLRQVKEEVPVSGLFDALGLGWKRTVHEVAGVFRTIARFIGGDISFSKNVAGPLSIAQVASATASIGWATFLGWLAIISVNLAVLNILPVPILDGGTIVVLIAEKVRGGRPLPDAAIVRLQLVGMGLLLILMFFALKNDIFHLSN